MRVCKQEWVRIRTVVVAVITSLLFVTFKLIRIAPQGDRQRESWDRETKDIIMIIYIIY